MLFQTTEQALWCAVWCTCLLYTLWGWAHVCAWCGRTWRHRWYTLVALFMMAVFVPISIMLIFLFVLGRVVL